MLGRIIAAAILAVSVLLLAYYGAQAILLVRLSRRIKKVLRATGFYDDAGPKA
jgi:hypothetical protein